MLLQAKSSMVFLLLIFLPWVANVQEKQVKNSKGNVKFLICGTDDLPYCPIFFTVFDLRTIKTSSGEQITRKVFRQYLKSLKQTRKPLNIGLVIQDPTNITMADTQRLIADCKSSINPGISCTVIFIVPHPKMKRGRTGQNVQRLSKRLSK